MLKFLSDPNGVVRNAGLNTLEAGNYYQPGPAIVAQVKALTHSSGLHHLESGIASNILASIEGNLYEPRGPFQSASLAPLPDPMAALPTTTSTTATQSTSTGSPASRGLGRGLRSRIDKQMFSGMFGDPKEVPNFV